MPISAYLDTLPALGARIFLHDSAQVIGNDVDKSKSLTYKKVYPLIVRNRWERDISERMSGVRKTGSGVDGR